MRPDHVGLLSTELFERYQRSEKALVGTLERVPIKWKHLIDKDSLKIKELEHVLIEKVEQLFWDMLWRRCMCRAFRRGR